MYNGFRNIGPRKEKLINIATQHLIILRAKGVNIPRLQKYLGIKGSAHSITTKQWTGVIGSLVEFRRDNGL